MSINSDDSEMREKYTSVEELRERYSDKDLPLEGVRVLSFAWVHAGPLATSVLAQLGAEVIKIESTRRPDFLRFTFPRPDGAADDDPEKGGLFLRLNIGGKKDVNVNMQSDRADEVMEPLIEESDIVVENFTAEAMERMGWSYERMKEVNPQIIYVSAASYGHTGPKSHYRGYGSTIDATTGIIQQNGYPDLNPMNNQTSYPDSVGGVTTAYATLSALIDREQTGEGQHVDLDQVEATTSLNGSAVVEASVNDEVRPVIGNTDREISPHGIYPCEGEDEWIAITARDDEEWQSLCEMMDDPDLVTEFPTNADRLERREQLDDRISDWTEGKLKFDVLEQLQEADVPSGAVQTQRDIIQDDEHLRDREALQLISYDDIGPLPFQALPFKYSESPVSAGDRAPKLGEHTRGVIKEVVGLTDAEIDELTDEEVLI